MKDYFTYMLDNDLENFKKIENIPKEALYNSILLDNIEMFKHCIDIGIKYDIDVIKKSCEMFGRTGFVEYIEAVEYAKKRISNIKDFLDNGLLQH